MEDLSEFAQAARDFVKGVSEELTASGISKQVPGVGRSLAPAFAWCRDHVAPAAACWRRNCRRPFQEFRQCYRVILGLPGPVKGILAVFYLNLLVMACWEGASPGTAPRAVTTIPAGGMALGLAGCTYFGAMGVFRFARNHVRAF